MTTDSQRFYRLIRTLREQKRFRWMSDDDLNILCRAAYEAGKSGTQEDADRFGEMQERLKGLGVIPERTVWLKCVTGVNDKSETIMEANIWLESKSQGWLTDLVWW